MTFYLLRLPGYLSEILILNQLLNRVYNQAMLKASNTILINTKPEKVFHLITNHNLWPSLLPSLNRIWDNPGVPIPVGGSNKWEFYFMGIPFRGTWTTTNYKEPELYEGDTEGSILSHWTFKLEPKGNSTKLSLEVKYREPISRLKRFQQHFIERYYQKEAKQFLKNIKELCEQ